MPGLLDALSGYLQSPDARMSLGLLSAAGPQAQPMNLGQRLQGVMGQLQQQNVADEERKQRAAMQALQMQQLQQALAHGQFQQQHEQQQATRQQAMEALPAQFMQQGRPAEMIGSRDEGAPAQAPGFDMAGYANAMFKYDPKTALAMQGSMRKDTTPFVLKAGELAYGQGSNGPDFSKPLAHAPKDQTPTELSKLLLERGLLPPADPRRAIYDQQISKLTTHAPGVNVSYGAPVAGVDAAGKPVFFQPDKQGGQPSIIPGVQPPPREVPASVKKDLAENAVMIDKIDRALAGVQSNPGAFGLQNVFGDAVSQRFDPKGVEARAMVADIGSQKIHDRSGAAVSASETPRLKPFVPGVNDPPKAIATKLGLFRQEYARMQQELNSGGTLKQVAQPTSKSVLDAADAILGGK